MYPLLLFAHCTGSTNMLETILVVCGTTTRTVAEQLCASVIFTVWLPGVVAKTEELWKALLSSEYLYGPVPPNALTAIWPLVSPTQVGFVMVEDAPSVRGCGTIISVTV